MSYCLNAGCQKPQNPDGNKFCQNCGLRLLLGDRYRTFQPVGKGESSRTFLAVDTTKLVKPQCIVKEFSYRSHQGQEAEAAMEALRQEVARLDELSQHPQIPDLLEYFERGQQQYLVQEFINGQNLEQQLEQEGTFDEAQIWQLLNDLLPLLQYLHAHQIIHRDIKPTNLIRRHVSDQLVLVDFGAAKQLTKTSLAKPGTVVGSAEYTAPEQLMGKAIFASDLYSLGVTCIHLLTGLSPFDLFNSATGTWMWRSVAGSISVPLEYVLDRLLQSTASQRYQSAQAVLQDLQSRASETGASETGASETGTSEREITHVSRIPVAQPLLSGLDAPDIVPSSTQAVFPTWKSVRMLGEDLGLSVSVNAIAFSNDQVLVSAHSDAAIRVWDFVTGKLLQTLRGHHQVVAAVAASCGGQRLVSGSWDTTIKLWELRTGKLLHTLQGHSGPVTAIALSPDGQLLASGSRDQSVKLWSLAEAELLHTFSGHTKAVESLAFGSGDRVLASGGADGLVKIWHCGTRELIRTFSGHRGVVGAIALTSISPETSAIVSSSWDMSIKLRKLSTGRLFHTFTGHLLPTASIAISPDQRMLITGSHDTTVKLWNLSNGKLLDTLFSHIGAVESVALSPDGKTIASGSRDGAIALWQQHT